METSKENTYYWKGESMEDMSKEELIEALKEVSELYTDSLKEHRRQLNLLHNK